MSAFERRFKGVAMLAQADVKLKMFNTGISIAAIKKNDNFHTYMT